MKNILTSLILFTFLLPIVSSAKNLSDLKIISTSDIRTTCNYTEEAYGISPLIEGCYWPTQNKIYINSTLSNEDFKFSLFHEFGHWITEGENMSLFGNEWESAADYFAIWALGTKLSVEKNNYFKGLIEKLNI